MIHLGTLVRSILMEVMHIFNHEIWRSTYRKFENCTQKAREPEDGEDEIGSHYWKPGGREITPSAPSEPSVRDS